MHCAGLNGQDIHKMISCENVIPPDISNERELLTAAQTGEPEAFAGLYYQYYEVIYNQALGKVGCNPDAAQDITQEVFYNAFRALPSYQYRGGNYFKRWLQVIASNQIVNYARRTNTNPEVPAGGQNYEWQLTNTASGDNPQESALNELAPFSPEVETALNRLKKRNENFYHALMEVIVGGMTPAEFAAANNLPTKTVYTRLHRAKRMLRHSLTQEEATAA